MTAAEPPGYTSNLRRQDKGQTDTKCWVAKSGFGRTYKYYLTRFGKQVITTRLKLRDPVIIPQLASECAQ
jgi:hypothetical protein